MESIADLPGTIAGREANVVSRFTTFVVTDKTEGRQPVPFLEHASLDNHLLPANLRTKPGSKGSKVRRLCLCLFVCLFVGVLHPDSI